MARGVANVLQIIVLAAGAYAALTAGRTHVGTLVTPQKDILELHHPGVGEQQGWVIARY